LLFLIYAEVRNMPYELKGGLECFRSKMTDDANSDNRGFRTVALILDALQEHERNIDESIDRLSEIMDRVAGLNELKSRLERVEQSLDAISGDVKKIAAYLSENRGN
jgi:DNA repair ATPase RecN